MTFHTKTAVGYDFDGYDDCPPTPQLAQVTIASLTLDPRFQARSGIDERTLKRYVGKLMMGFSPPPIEVALVEGKAFVIDGFHRVASLIQTGKTEVSISITEMTMGAALIRAGCANHDHGLPLSHKDLVRAHQMAVKGYIAEGRHLEGKRCVKSLRDISRDLKELGCVISHSGVRRTIQKYHPDLYRKHFSHDVPSGGGLPDKDRDLIDCASAALAACEAMVRGLPPEGKDRLTTELKDVLGRIDGDAPFTIPVQVTDPVYDCDEF